MRSDTLARLEELAKQVSRYAKRRVEPLQLAALIIERHLALRQTHATQGGVATHRDARRGPVSGLDVVRDLVGSVSGAPGLSTRILRPVRASRITPKKQKRSGRGSGSQHTSRSARPFPD
jgi:hypothetical protein